MFLNSSKLLRVLTSLKFCRASCHLHDQPFNPMAADLLLPSHSFRLQNGLIQPKKRNTSYHRSSSLQRYTAGLCKQGPPRPPGGIKTNSIIAKYAASEVTSSASNSLCKEDCSLDLEQNGASSSISDQTTLSPADEMGRRAKSTSLNKLSISPGEVHVWWLFPDDVRSRPKPQSY
jgi:hypothetical protein